MPKRKPKTENERLSASMHSLLQMNPNLFTFTEHPLGANIKTKTKNKSKNKEKQKMAFHKAERKQVKLKLGISAPSGAGKTFSALLLAYGICGDWSKIAVIDTENGSAELYSHLGDYSVCTISAPFTPEKYINAIKEAEQAGFKVLIIDSLSHAWTGEGGLLDIQAAITKASRSGNSYTAWREVSPLHAKLVDAFLQSDMDVIVTVRAKTAYEMVEKDGKKTPQKVGLEPVFRDGLEYEVTTMLTLSQDHIATASKDRTQLFDGKYFTPTVEHGQQLADWRDSGADWKCSVCGKSIPKKTYEQSVQKYSVALCSKECKDKVIPPDGAAQ